MIDYIIKFIYIEIDLNENFCIISFYDHIFILKNMNNHMKIAKYYIIFNNIIDENSIIELKSKLISFSISKLKKYFIYYNFFHNINKYDRIIRRAWIDETIKKFII